MGNKSGNSKLNHGRCRRLFHGGPHEAYIEEESQIATVLPAAFEFVCLASGQKDSDEAPFSICECVYLRVVPSTRAANSLLFLPPFPPAAERCAFTCVESIV